MHLVGLGSCRSESCGATGSSAGLTLTPSSTANAKGSWSTLRAGTSFAYEALSVFLYNGDAADWVVDLGIDDGSGNVFVIAADLRMAGLRIIEEQGVWLYLPVHVPAGATLVARSACSLSGAGHFVLCALIGHERGLGGAAGFSRCIALNSFSSSRGVAIDPGGTANTKGSWAQITASCPNDIAAIFGLIGHNGDLSRAAGALSLIDIGIGSAGSEFVLYPNVPICWSTARDGPANCPRIPLFAADVPVGSRIAARSSCNINTAGDRTLDLSLYALVK